MHCSQISNWMAQQPCCLVQVGRDQGREREKIALVNLDCLGLKQDVTACCNHHWIYHKPTPFYFAQTSHHLRNDCCVAKQTSLDRSDREIFQRKLDLLTHDFWIGRLDARNFSRYFRDDTCDCGKSVNAERGKCF
jgi:hypothetical protein